MTFASPAKSVAVSNQSRARSRGYCDIPRVHPTILNIFAFIFSMPRGAHKSSNDEPSWHGFSCLASCQGSGAIELMPDKRGGLNGSTQHPLEVSLQGAQQLKVIRERR